MGGSGAIFSYPDKPNMLAKLPYRKPSYSLIENLEVEKRIYRRLQSHPNIILCLDIDDDAIYLERAKYGCNIRQYYRDGGTATRRERINWSRDLANAVQPKPDMEQIDTADVMAIMAASAERYDTPFLNTNPWATGHLGLKSCY